jgi:hypothetical protein
VLVTGGAIGAGGGASHEPGSDTIRAMIFERGYGRIALAVAGLGVAVLFASLFFRKSDTY